MSRIGGDESRLSRYSFDDGCLGRQACGNTGRTMTEGRLLYRPAEAAELLGVSRAQLYILLAREEIGSVKIGASRRVPAADLEAYVSRLRAAYSGCDVAGSASQKGD